MGHCLPYHPSQATAMKPPIKFLAYHLPGSDQSDQATHSGDEATAHPPAASVKATAGATQAVSSQRGRNNSTAKAQRSCPPARSLSVTPNRVVEAKATSAMQANGRNGASLPAWEPATPNSTLPIVPQAATSCPPYSVPGRADGRIPKGAASGSKRAEAKGSARVPPATECDRIAWPSSTIHCHNRETDTRRYRLDNQNGAF